MKTLCVRLSSVIGYNDVEFKTLALVPKWSEGSLHIFKAYFVELNIWV